MYHLFALPYLYEESNWLGEFTCRLRNIKQTALVCVDLYPQFRNIQHRAFEIVMRLTDEKEKQEMRSIAENEMEVVKQIKEEYEFIDSAMGGDAREALLKKIREFVTNVIQKYTFKVIVTY